MSAAVNDLNQRIAELVMADYDRGWSIHRIAKRHALSKGQVLELIMRSLRAADGKV